MQRVVALGEHPGSRLLVPPLDAPPPLALYERSQGNTRGRELLSQLLGARLIVRELVVPVARTGGRRRIA